jgi:molybdopterin molybdotransferase
MLLRAMCERAGATVVADDMIGDEPDAIAAWLRDAGARADLIVTSGGASVGEHDWIRNILEREGTLQMWRVAIKPGKPIAFGRIGGTPVFALPGNPGSAFVCAHVFVQPAIRLMGARDPAPLRLPARLGGDVKGSPSRTMFARVRLDGELAVPLPAQSSVVLSNLIPADGFAIVPPGGAREGAEVVVELID